MIKLLVSKPCRFHGTYTEARAQCLSSRQMAKYKIIWAIVLSSLIAAPAAAQDPDSMAVQRQALNQQPGLENVESLALLLHQALQNNNFDSIRQHLVNKQVYDKMLQLGTASVRETLLLYSPTDMLQDFQRDFGRVIQDGITLEVDWPSTFIHESLMADISPTENAIIFPMQLQLSSASGLPFQVQVHAARLDGRYYLLPPLRLTEQY